MTTKSQFLDKICENPDDKFQMLVYRDFLLENGGEEEANAWQWIIENEKKPEINKRGYDWWRENLDSGFSIRHQIDWFLVDEMKRGVNGIIAQYKTQQEAFLDLVRVLMENKELWNLQVNG